MLNCASMNEKQALIDEFIATGAEIIASINIPENDSPVSHFLKRKLVFGYDTKIRKDAHLRIIDEAFYLIVMSCMEENGNLRDEDFINTLPCLLKYDSSKGNLIVTHTVLKNVEGMRDFVRSLAYRPTPEMVQIFGRNRHLNSKFSRNYIDLALKLVKSCNYPNYNDYVAMLELCYADTDEMLNRWK
jgi:hypothetical protein